MWRWLKKAGIRARFWKMAHAQTARLWQTSRQVVRKWVRRFQQQGQAGLARLQPPPSPLPTSEAVEAQVVQVNILRRHGLIPPLRKRKVCSPAHWAWQTRTPFALAQVDVKDIRDEATLGPRLVHPGASAALPVDLPRGQNPLAVFGVQPPHPNALCCAGLRGITQRVQWQTEASGAGRACSSGSTGGSLRPWERSWCASL
ncbi:MAG: hypothetical protein N3E42_05305, partial [Candidatus Bipolaricaulota bacterium]|nr:hypothetical protein [Candidatus Bipolaricaulota bacterium]